jgi:hypothetical protein
MKLKLEGLSKRNHSSADALFTTILLGIASRAGGSHIVLAQKLDRSIGIEDQTRESERELRQKISDARGGK